MKNKLDCTEGNVSSMWVPLVGPPPPFHHFDKKLKKIWGSKKKSGGINFFSEKISDFLKKSWKKNLGSKKNLKVSKFFWGKFQISWQKFDCSNIVQILFKYDLQILSFKYCSSNIVQKGTPLKILCINSNAGHSSSVDSLLSPRGKYHRSRIST